jgi:cytochrome P450
MLADGSDLTDVGLFVGGFPHELFARLRADGPYQWHEDGGDDGGFWVVVRHAEVVAIAADAARYSSDGSQVRPAGGGTLLEDLPGGTTAGVLLNMQDDPRHQILRKHLLPTMSPRSMAALVDELRDRTVALVGDAVERGACDAVADISTELPLQAMARLLGVPQDDRHRLFAWMEATLGHSTDAAAGAAASMFGYGTSLLAEKARCPADDLMTAVATGPFDEAERLMAFNLLVAAGSETTRGSIAAGILAFARHPGEWARLVADRALLPTAVEEVLRWASSTTYNRRTALVDTDLARRGQRVTLWWPSANRDALAFDDPDRFDVGRAPNRHVAFGWGTHVCLGAGLARLEVRLVLEALLDHGVDAFEVDGDVEWVRSNKHTAIERLPVRLVSR